MKKTTLILSFITFLAFGADAFAQENETIFRSAGIRRSGGYAAVSNKFTTINGSFANMPEIYAGWFVNQRFLLGVSGAATTNRIPVPLVRQNFPGRRMTYQYGQFGLMTEYVFASTRAVHFNVNLFGGAGFSMQYDRRNFGDWDDWDDRWDDWDDNDDPSFFPVIEPGVQIEFNLLKWMRFSPGVSYRQTFNSRSNGLSDNDLSNISYNLTLKFGRF